MNFSGIVVTLNEEKNLKRCLDSLFKVCDEVVVVDSGSIDETVEIANSYGAKVIFHEYLGDGKQKNFAIGHVKHDWIVQLDADESIDDIAIEELNAFKASGLIEKYDALGFRRKTHIGKRWVKSCGWYPDPCVRVLNKKRAAFTDSVEHTRVIASKTMIFEGHILHYSFDSYSDLFDRTNRFTTRSARNLFLNERRVNGFSPFLHAFVRFFMKYFVKRGFLDGLDGLTVAIGQALGAYLKYAKLVEYQREGKAPENMWG